MTATVRSILSIMLATLMLAWAVPGQAQKSAKSPKPQQACSHPELDFSRFDDCCAQGHTLSCVKKEIYAPEPDTEKLRKYCYENKIAKACVAYLNQRTEEETKPKTPKSAALEAMPAVCDEKNSAFNQDACMKEIGKAIMKDAATSFSSMYDAPKAQSDALLREKRELCSTMKEAEICDLASTGYWDSKYFSDAVEILQFACKEISQNKESCNHSGPLKPYAEQLKSGGQDSTTLPCGTYKGEGLLIPELEFLDFGKVGTGLQGMRARLENGNIHIRHDKGGDFIFRQITPTAYIGLDTWNRFGVIKQTKSATCKAPKKYQEKPLSNDCPSVDPKELNTCCTQGSSGACNILGNMSVLDGKYKAATDFYTKSCSQGARISCENIITVAQTGGVQHLDALKKACATNPEGVACEVAETVNPQYIKMMNDIKKMGDAIENKASGKGRLK